MELSKRKAIDNYIVDFFCNELMLAIEIDGESHHGNEAKDILRQQNIEKFGINFLRFDEIEIYYAMDKVLEKIENWIVEKEK